MNNQKLTYNQIKDKFDCSAEGQQSTGCEVLTKQTKGGNLPPFTLPKNKANYLISNVGNKTCDISRKYETEKEKIDRAQISRSRIYNLRFKAGDIIGGRTAKCGCVAGWDEKRDISIMQKDNNFYLSGVETCSSVWNCPVCALKISQRRADQVREILTWSQSRNEFSHGFLTLTTRHKKNEDCETVKKRVLKAWRKTTQTRQYKEFGAETIRALEVKFNTTNGWHPHLHIAIIAEKTSAELETFVNNFIIPKYLKLIGCETLKQNQKYKAMYAGNGISDYITKWDMSLELTHAQSKTDFSNSLTPFGMLNELSKKYVQWNDIETNNFHVELEMAFKEYAKAFKGSKQLTISRKLKLKFKDFDSQTDEDICKEEQASEKKLSISRDLFKEIAGQRVQADVLNSYQYGGLALVQVQLLEFGINSEYNSDTNTLESVEKFKGWGKLNINYNFHRAKEPPQQVLKLYFD